MSTATIPIPALLSPDELAELLSVSRRQIDILLRRGEIPAPIQLGHRRRWRGTDIADHLAKQPLCDCAG